MKALFLLSALLLPPQMLQSSEGIKVRSLKDRAKIRSELNIKRVNTLLLPAMRNAGIDCWIIMSREFNKDFVLEYVEDNLENTPGGHRNAYIFFDDGSEELKKILLGTHLPRGSRLWDQMNSYHRGEGEDGPSLKPILRKTIAELDPQVIAINESRTIPLCDGLTVAMKKFLVESIGPKYEKRLVSAEKMIVQFLDTRLPEEMQYFEEAAQMSKAIHHGVLNMITPGKTTIEDMRWYVYNKLAEFRADTWYFHGLRVIREGTPRLDADSVVIQPGDLINNDIGVVYMGFHTDYKGTGYVLKSGETEPPQGLQEAFKNSLKVQDAIFEISRVGKIGHKIVDEAEELCRQWGIEGRVYSHSTGIGGHGIGVWMNPAWPDRYGSRTLFPLRKGAYYAIESHAVTEIPEWKGQKISVNTEEDVFLAEKGFAYVVPRQEKIIVITGEGEK